ncbi:MAG TPA: hypothetical protein PK435_14245 [Thermoanaerobaculaceae bacterium]|nr:hypothetical protein [Thermoanaerobaculaceae bacterium]
MDVAPAASQLDRRPGRGPGYDVLGHHLGRLFVLDFFEEHRRRGVLVPVCGGREVYLDGRLRPIPEPDCEALLEAVGEEGPGWALQRAPRDPRVRRVAIRLAGRHDGRRRGRPGGRVGSGGVKLGPGRAYEFEALFLPAADVGEDAEAEG